MLSLALPNCCYRCTTSLLVPSYRTAAITYLTASSVLAHLPGGRFSSEALARRQKSNFTSLVSGFSFSFI
uniref:Uncharacterized protein n=1 Tax=Picea glauca TaxID=3330 RepID=A0A117NGZ2_PICGL|nr:hypothetical protein ABT39_MTgene5729 [Picea glauca]QHR90661.1 hypothetical protein Q903MT_gene4686 [Picea sitchensis]